MRQFDECDHFFIRSEVGDNFVKKRPKTATRHLERFTLTLRTVVENALNRL